MWGERDPTPRLGKGPPLMLPLGSGPSLVQMPARPDSGASAPKPGTPDGFEHVACKRRAPIKTSRKEGGVAPKELKPFSNSERGEGRGGPLGKKGTHPKATTLFNLMPLRQRGGLRAPPFIALNAWEPTRVHSTPPMRY